MIKPQLLFTRHNSGSPPPSGLQDAMHLDMPVWRPIRGPFERWPHLTDLLIALLSLGLNLLLWARNGEVSLASLPEVAAYLCVVIASFALLWRRSHPWQVHAVILGLSLLLYVALPVDGNVAMAFSLYCLGRYEADQRASVIGAGAAFGFVVVDQLILDNASTGSAFAALMVLALWYMGRRLRFRGEYLRLLEERAEYLEREQSAESERAVAAERARIAREMHDIVAHQVSLMTVQAGAARTIAISNPEAAGEAMASVETAGRHALAEMRRLLGVLRVADARGALAPQPGISDLPNLVRQVNDVGLQVQLRTQGNFSGLPAGLELTVFRIVQEALTNALKHAGPHANVTVTVETRHTELAVLVLDDGPGCSMPANGGHGIAGMRERVQLLGGSFSAGNSAHMGFEVRAVLPVPPE